MFEVGALSMPKKGFPKNGQLISGQFSFIFINRLRFNPSFRKAIAMEIVCSIKLNFNLN